MAAGTDELYRNFPVLVIVLAGGMTTNGIWCLTMNARNRSGGDYTKSGPTQLVNYFYAAAAGITWYLQFMFYGMGTTRMGVYDFSSWTLHMAFIIAFSNVWGLYFKEWQGAPRRAVSLVVLGILVLVLSTVVVGAGNYFASAAVAAQ
jgi:L-rhamnose-H+ transport protein